MKESLAVWGVVFCMFFLAGWSQGDFDVRRGLWAGSLFISTTGFVVCCIGRKIIGLPILVIGFALFVLTCPR